MGCDIHLVVERRWNDKWVGVNALKSHYKTLYGEEELNNGWSLPIAKARNYARFGALAGVRYEGPSPRGLPNDISDLTKIETEYWGADGHSHSWLPINEAAKIFAETNGKPLNEWQAKYPACYFFDIESETLDDFRLIFWFDN